MPAQIGEQKIYGWSQLFNAGMEKADVAVISRDIKVWER